MLKQRVITAIILLAILLGALLATSPWPLVLLLTVAAGCTLFEWLRLTWPGSPGAMPAILGSLLALGVLAVAYQWLSPEPASWAVELKSWLNFWVIPGVAIIWIVAATALVVRGQAQQKTHGIWLSLFGMFAVLTVWASLVQLYLAHGAWYLVSLLALIWCADIGAYFVGKAIGRRKLAPKVSPGKTWEGAMGGVAAATAWVLVSMYWPGSFGATLALRWPIGLVILIAIGLAAISIVGDLFESLLKRRAGVKDSSQLLPGHGGVYDRIDALLPVAPLVLLLTGLPV